MTEHIEYKKPAGVRYPIPPAQRENPTCPAAKVLLEREQHDEPAPQTELPMTLGEWGMLVGINIIMGLSICAGLAWLAGWPL